MNILSASLHPLRLGCALAIFAAASGVQAQQSSSGGPVTIYPEAPPPSNVMGGPAAGPSNGVESGPYTAVQIARSFIVADANRDGELTRAEAQRLTIMPYSFEEMDRNRDGVLSRFEYEDGVR